jgi:uncharacterized phosphosugar-binding protein
MSATALLIVACVLSAPPAAGPAQQYIDAQLRVAHSLEAKLDDLAAIADESAARLLAGGKIYLAGEKGMVEELLSRAGGLCAAKWLPLERRMPAVGRDDIILLSDYGTPEKLKAAVEKLGPSGALVVVFASAENPLLRGPLLGNFRAVPVDIPLDSRLVALSADQRSIPTASPAIATAQWTYIAELLGACRRQHKQLAIFLSVSLDEGRTRYNRTKGLLFEPELRPEPVTRGEFGRAFLATVEQSLQGVRNEEVEHIRQAADWLREAIAANGKIVRNLQGHLPPSEVKARGDVPFFTDMTRLTGEPGEKWIRENLRVGDIYLLLGYQSNEDALAAAAHALGARTIFITSTAPGKTQAGSPRHLYINPHWPLTDACLELPGYDVNACPISGILGLTCYYAICGEAVSK